MSHKIVFTALALLSQIAFGQLAMAIEKVVITVNDLHVSVPFYEEILDFEKIESYTLEGTDFQRLLGIDNATLYAKVVELQLGQEIIALQEFVNESQSRRIPLDSKSNDLWFQHIAIVVSDMDRAYEKLWNAGVAHVSTAPQTLPDYITAAAGIKAFYFQDPDGHILEVINFPDSKGDSKWQQDNASLFMGIDHTAIAIEKTVPSSEFYEDVLGLKIMGHSENYGTEQEHLNQIFGARLWITGLRAKQGMGVEFLDFIAPQGGRAYPIHSTPTDLWHWQTVIKVEHIEDTYKHLGHTDATFISKRIVNVKGRKQFMIRDVDGHALLITE